MNKPHPGNVNHALAPPAHSAGDAKSRMLAWAEESDARARRTRLKLAKLAAGSALAALSALALVRVLDTRRAVPPGRFTETPAKSRHTPWTLAVGAGRWLAPYAIRALLNSVQSRPGANGAGGSTPK